MAKDWNQLPRLEKRNRDTNHVWFRKGETKLYSLKEVVMGCIKDLLNT